ncbi:MAG: signal recognition particle protein [Deltaproteobacteria bacterium]|nr:signal recognition particle protein [Deltaproteobacteria bacterium]
MLEILSKGFNNAKAALTGHAVLTPQNIDDAVREIRVSLLEADVEVGVSRVFLDRVKERAIGEVVTLETKSGAKKLTTTPGEHFVLICHNEIEKLLGPVEEAPIVFRRPYTIIMMVGLQGTGKTTTAAKLASYLKADGRRPMLVAADIYRPAAVEQLQQLGLRVGVPVYAAPGLAPEQLCQDALREAKKKKRDVVIFDTAGRLAIDDVLMTELEEIKRRTRPDNTFLVCDAMAGQDTVRTASEFNRRLDITGFILTKIDGDARGGAALSIKEVTGKPIKFLGVGEGLDRLEPFRPEGLASRILGMGDIVGLMRDFEQVVDERQAERDTRKLLRGEFTLDDFLSQLKMLQKVGSVSEIYEKFPIFGDAGLPEGAKIDDKAFTVMESLIHSMTRAERHTPAIIDQRRAERIAKGSGRKPEAVLDLVQRFGMMHTMMANLASSPGLLGMLPGFKQLSQVRKLKGMKTDDILGGMSDSIRSMAKGKPMMLPQGGFAPPPGLPGMPFGQGLPGLPAGNSGLPGLPGMPGGLQRLPDGRVAIPKDAIPPGMSPAQYLAMLQGQEQAGPAARQVTSKQKQKAKSKRKAEKAARKKSRRR